MNKNVKTLIYIGSGLAVTTVAIIVAKKQIERKRAQEQGEEIEDVSVVSDVVNTVIPPCMMSVSFPITKGTKGKQAGDVQKFLNKFGGFSLKEDCIYGQVSSDAMSSFLRKKDIVLRSGLDRDFYNDYIALALRNGKLPTASSSITGTLLGAATRN